MSDNIQFKGFPNEVISNIVSFLDQQSQSYFSQTCKRFNVVTTDTVRAETKSELKMFKKFIKEKSKASFEQYDKMGTALKKFNRLPQGKGLFIDSYYRNQWALETLIDRLCDNNNEQMTSLEKIQEKRRELFQLLQSSKVIFYIIKHFPEITNEIKTQCAPRFFSSYNMFHEIINKYTLLNTLLIERNDCSNQNLLREIEVIIYQERLLLILDGYINTGCDILPIINDTKQIEILCFMIISLKAHKSFSLSNIKNILNAISLINNEDVRTKIFKILLNSSDEIQEAVYLEVTSMEKNHEVKLEILKKYCTLPLSNKMTQRVFHKLINILQETQDNDEISSIFINICYLNLNQNQKEELLEIAKRLPNITIADNEEPDELDEMNNQKLLAFESLCDLKLLPKEVENKLDLAFYMSYEIETIILLITLCKHLPDQQKDNIFKLAYNMKCEKKIALLAALYKYSSSGDLRHKIFTLSLKMTSHEQESIFPTICKFELSQDDRSTILNAVTNMRNDWGKITTLINLCELHNLSKEERTKIVNIVKELIVNMNYNNAIDILAALYRPELPENEKEEIYAIIKDPFTYHPNKQPIFFRTLYERETSKEAKAKIFSIVLSNIAEYSSNKMLINFYASNPSKEEKNQIFQLLETIKNEEDKVEFLYNLANNIQWSSDEMKKIASLALQISDPDARRDIFVALASNNNRSNEHENTIIIEEVIE